MFYLLLQLLQYNNAIKILKNLKHWKVFIMTTFWRKAGKSYQILGQVPCPKTLELKIFEIKKCSKSFFCCKNILEVSEIIYKKEQIQIIFKFIFCCERSSLVGKIHRPYWNITKTQDFWMHKAYKQMVKVQRHVRSCREREFKMLSFFQIV